jgi:uncharacterized protein YkwD
MNQGLTQAARAHSKEMAARNQLSHQFSGEPGLTQRLAANSSLHMDQAGENVGVAASPEQAHDGFMHSPPHRENLLNPDFNVAGFGVVRSGNMMYVTQDFGHSLPTYSGDKAQDAVADAVAKTRAQAGLAPLKNVQSDAAQFAACSMSKADALTRQSLPGRHIVRYTANSPSQLPNGSEKAIDDPAATTFSLGLCYSRTSTYPSGIYWIVLVIS